jgi:molecular chaperone GrpE
MVTLPAELRLLSWVDGVSLIGHKLEVTMQAEGVEPIEAAGQQFDPEQHEAVLREEATEHPDGQVIAELQRGYMLHDRVLRPTLVKVAVAPAASPEPAAPAQESEPPGEESASVGTPGADDTPSSPSEQPGG